jgi:hypothetical protein
MSWQEFSSWFRFQDQVMCMISWGSRCKTSH